MKSIFSEEFWMPVYARFLKWLLFEIPSLVITIIIFVIALKFFGKLVDKIRPFLLKRNYIEKSLNKEEAQKRMTTLINITQNMVRIFLWIVFIMILLSKMGIEIAPLLAGAGILGLAVGFGAQQLVRDVISGFFMLLENQVRVGDVAIINNTTGTVEKIELRTITLRDFTGTVHIFQNGKINSLSNTTKDWSAAVFEVAVAYKENVNNVVELMKQVAAGLLADENFAPKIISDIEISGLDRYENSAVIIKARMKTQPGDHMKIKREYQNRLKYLFDEHHIEMPFPHTTLYWGEQSPVLKVKMEN